MSNITAPFSFDNLLQAPTPQSGFISSNFYVRNSGLYDVQVYDAQLVQNQRNGEVSERIQIRAFATHKEHPDHCGRAIFSIFVPDQTKQRASDLTYYSLAQLANILRTQTAPDGRQYATADWQVTETTGFNNTPVKSVVALKDKHFIFALRHGTSSQGKAVLNVDAVFSIDGYSASEILNNAPAQRRPPVDITNFVYQYENNALEPVQRSSASVAATANSFLATATQQPAQAAATQGFTPAPQGYAPQPAQSFTPQEPAQAFAAQQPTQAFAAQQPAQSYTPQPPVATQDFSQQQSAPQAPQYQGYGQAQQPAQAFAAQQPNPYGAMAQGAQPVDTSNITQQQDDTIPY